jgi:hypothetical protein
VGTDCFLPFFVFSFSGTVKQKVGAFKLRPGRKLVIFHYYCDITKGVLEMSLKVRRRVSPGLCCLFVFWCYQWISLLISLFRFVRTCLWTLRCGDLFYCNPRKKKKEKNSFPSLFVACVRLENLSSLFPDRVSSRLPSRRFSSCFASKTGLV